MNRAIKLIDENGNSCFPCPYYPVGSIYLSVNSTNPSKIFGGTWTQIKDRFLLTAGNTYKAGNTGGSATHQLTINEMPSHDHGYNTPRFYYAEEAGGGQVLGANDDATYLFTRGTTYTGGNAAHNNMPPYLVVYAWKRVS